MADYTQAKRPLAITTPLGKDVLLLASFKGQEAISQMFRFQVDMLAKLDTKVSFDAILGQSVTVELVNSPDSSKRHFNGIVNRFTSGRRDETFTHYRAEIVPKLWLLSKKSQSKIFQHLPIPDILKKVLVGFDVKWEITGSYYPRDFCVQYRESDFAFASRLMEEEGIYYFFKHSDGNHTMVVTDDPTTHPDVQGQSSIPFEQLRGGARDEMRVEGWEKTQELTSAKVTLWDNCFELPNKNLEAKKETQDTVTVGKASHKLKLAANAPLEVYDYPGEYAQRFDGVDRGGGDRPPDLQEIFKDNLRTAKLRMEAEAVGSIEIQAGGNCGQFSAGHKFTLMKHPGDADGAYILTRVEHAARMDHYRSDKESPFSYQNRFNAIPAALPYRPARVTPRPRIAGTQSAVVVGPPGEEVFVDKYGRVKVQFHWDRDGKKNLDSSCWLRVSQVWAGKRWGAFFWPRIGHEVVVAFEEGDPDQPIIVGNVYNAENMPPFPLPLSKQLGGLKSASVRGASLRNFNGVIFNDQKGQEHLAIHSERNMSLNSEFDKMIHAGRGKGERVSLVNMLTIGNLPVGGGSGGGDSHFNAGNTMPEPPPLAVLGLNSVMTFGENLQAAAGLNHQLGLGSNLQLCVNPLGLVAGVPNVPLAPLLTAAFGSGIGGNVQFTIGSDVYFVLGQSFDINLGPPRITVEAGLLDHPVTTCLCAALGVATILWFIAYEAHGQHGGYDPDDPTAKATASAGDKQRARIVIIFQFLIDVLLVAIMESEIYQKQFDKELNSKLFPLFRVETQKRELARVQEEVLRAKAYEASDYAIVDLPAFAVALLAILIPLEAVGGEAGI